MLLSVKPAARISAKLAMIDAGIASEATSTIRKFRMNTMITRLASRLPSSRCSSSEAIEARMNCESSRVTVTFTSGGSARRSGSSLARTASTTWTVFWPDCRRTSMTSVRSPSKNAAVRASAVVSSTRRDVAQPDRRAARRWWRRRCSRTARSTRAGRACAASARRPPAGCSRRAPRRSRTTMASRTRSTVSPCAFSFSMSRMTWISRAWPPEMVTSPTPSTVATARRICLSAISVSARSGSEPDSAKLTTGSASGSTFVMIGGSTSGGSSLSACATFSRTSCAASLMSRSRTNLSVIRPLPSRMTRLHLVDAGDAAERLLGRLDDGAVQFLGARAGQVEVDDDGRGIRLRQQIDAEIAEREDARHDEQHDQHRREDRAADAEIG